jgi:hypothetical protein
VSALSAGSVRLKLPELADCFENDRSVRFLILALGREHSLETPLDQAGAAHSELLRKSI